ncbi:MAG TPA: hypothetical protein VL426_02015 [Candidatus Binatia bacterium]|jgi:hypothetical protein|nr:hypothetical protein [Candidatus Binatia bacterium]
MESSAQSAAPATSNRLAAGSAVSAMVAAIVALCARIARGAQALRAAVAKAVRRMPVSYRVHETLMDDLGIVERHALEVAGRIADRDERARTYLELARLRDQLRRSPDAALRVLVEELRDPRWSGRADRIYLAARLSCSAAGLGAMHGCDEASRDAYLLGQTFYGKVSDADRKIGLAVAFSVSARLMGSVGDQASWLASAMDLACEARERESRIDAVRYVAEKMVEAGIPPSVSGGARQRFAVDASARAALPAPADDDLKLEF